jgi:LPXTG-motif cell wall-anchored protein
VEISATTGAAIYKYDSASSNYIVESPESGMIVIKGIASGDYTVIETEAPAGYNKMEKAIEIKAEEYASSTTTLTLYKDSEGKLVDIVTETVTTITFNEAAVAKNVINYTGTELPSTGGMGTTLFYIAGGLMVLVAGILLITKKRMKAEK